MLRTQVLLPVLAALAFLQTSPLAHANGRSPGSLLIFPEFDNRAGDVTMFTVTNTNTDENYNPNTNLPYGTVKVHFIYIGRVDAQNNPIPCLEIDREVTLTPGDTFTFSTKAHNPSQNQGFMYAYAVHPTNGKPITFDYLIGNALFISGIDAIDYSTNPVVLKGKTGHYFDTDIDYDGNRDLNDAEYEALPDQILIPRFLATGGALRSEIILLGLSGGSQFQTVVDFKIYNDNEELFSATRMFQCWERVKLDLVSNLFTNEFLKTTDHAVGEPLGAPTRESGWISLDGDVAFSSAGEQINDPAIYAVLIERVARGAGAADLPFEVGYQSNGSLWPNGPYGDDHQGDNR